jgi:hypothetical protein
MKAIKIIPILLIILLGITTTAFAQQLMAPSAAGEEPAIVSPIDTPTGEENQIVNQLIVNPAPEVQSAISDLEVKPAEIFSPVFSEVTNLVVNPAIEDAKLVYHLDLPVGTPIYKANELVKQPILNLTIDKPVEFKLSDNQIVINDEQIIDYKKIVGANEVMPPVELKINSAITDGKVHDLKLIPGEESGEFRFIYKENEVIMPIYSDFKVENQKIYLLHDEQVHDLRVLPPEIYAAIYSAIEAGESGKETEVKDLSVKVMDQKAVYDLKVNELFKLFWFIPMNIDRQYIIDSSDGAIIRDEKPWWAIGTYIHGLHSRVYVL